VAHIKVALVGHCGLHTSKMNKSFDFCRFACNGASVHAWQSLLKPRPSLDADAKFDRLLRTLEDAFTNAPDCKKAEVRFDLFSWETKEYTLRTAPGDLHYVLLLSSHHEMTLTAHTRLKALKEVQPKRTCQADSSFSLQVKRLGCPRDTSQTPPLMRGTRRARGRRLHGVGECRLVKPWGWLSTLMSISRSLHRVHTWVSASRRATHCLDIPR
jgi:hypothetical protein